MIGMMYLFLTALMALNVSGELLNAFILVDRGILRAKESVEVKNFQIYSEFESAYAVNQTRVGPYFYQSQELRSAADSLVRHVQSLKELFVYEADGEGYTVDNYISTNNTHVAAQIMITEQQGQRSQDLKRYINEYRELLIGMVENDSTLLASLALALSTDAPPAREGVQKSWEDEKFTYLPLSASMAILSQIQADVRNMESEVARYLFSRIDEGAFRFNSIEPLVIPRSNFVIQGDEYYAEIMVAASDTTQPPVVTVDGRGELQTLDGRGILRIPANNLGENRWRGQISVMGPDGVPRTHSVEGSFLVAQPNVVISPTRMNVFYEGVENPVEISAPGIPSENLRVSITNARITQRGGAFVVEPNAGSAGRESVISVVAMINGREQSLGNRNFRIARVPDPVAKVNNQREGTIPRAVLLAQIGIVADMEDFVFDLSFRVTQFTVSALRGQFMVDATSNSNRFTEEQMDIIRGTVRGQRLHIENIRAVGPDGRTRSLGSITLLID